MKLNVQSGDYKENELRLLMLHYHNPQKSLFC